MGSVVLYVGQILIALWVSGSTGVTSFNHVSQGMIRNAISLAITMYITKNIM